MQDYRVISREDEQFWREVQGQLLGDERFNDALSSKHDFLSGVIADNKRHSQDAQRAILEKHFLGLLTQNIDMASFRRSVFFCLRTVLERQVHLTSLLTEEMMIDSTSDFIKQCAQVSDEEAIESFKSNVLTMLLQEGEPTGHNALLSVTRVFAEAEANQIYRNDGWVKIWQVATDEEVEALLAENDWGRKYE